VDSGVIPNQRKTKGMAASLRLPIESVKICLSGRRTWANIFNGELPRERRR